MNSLNRERLAVWAMEFIERSSKESICELLTELAESLIDSEDIKFYDGTIAPYWDDNGEFIDGFDHDSK